MRTPLALAPLLLAVALSAAPSAQTTHIVNNGPEFQFSPADLPIQVGDTVKWVWVGGLHNVESGVGGIPDGIFTSGSPTPAAGTEFSVTFDQAFLDANPVPGDVYDYYCVIHVSLGQVGTVTVQTPATVLPYGCTNPVDSLTTLAGSPTVGTVWTMGVDNPLGTQPAGSLGFVALAATAAPGYPCGLPLPGFGMSAPGAAGELLISLNAPNPLAVLGPGVFGGPGSPASVNVPVPNIATLVGQQLFAQGILYDLSGTSGIAFGMTSGLAATIGS